MKITLAVLADYANVTREGKLNVMGIFDRLASRSVPVSHPQMTLVIRMEAHAAEAGRTHQLEVQCMDEDGGKVLTMEGEFTVNEMGRNEPTTTCDHLLTLNGVTFQKFGAHTFSIFVDKDLKVQVPLIVDELAGSQPSAAEH